MQVLFQVSSAAQRFLERELTAAHDMKSIVSMATAVLVSHSSSWPETLAKLDSVYDQLLDCYLKERQGNSNGFLKMIHDSYFSMSTTRLPK